MPTETRYMRNDQHTINGLLAYKLGITQTTRLVIVSHSTPGPQIVEWGIRVWKRDAGGTETEITGGTPVATVTRISDGVGIQSNTWDCPLVSLAPTDSIVIRVYTKIGDGAWLLSATFTTEQLGASQLDAATWTVYYHTERLYSLKMALTYGFYRFGIATHNSRIENFTWTEAVPPPPPPAKPLINKPLVNPVLINMPLIR